MLKIWLDDQCSDPDTPRRHTPNGWVGVTNSKDFILTVVYNLHELVNGQMEISFDHDLGETEHQSNCNGSFCADFICNLVISIRAQGIDCPAPVWSIHSTNPSGAANIESKMASLEKIVKRWAPGELTKV